MALRGGNAMNKGSARKSAKFVKPAKKNPYKIKFGAAPKPKPKVRKGGKVQTMELGKRGDRMRRRKGMM